MKTPKTPLDPYIKPKHPNQDGKWIYGALLICLLLSPIMLLLLFQIHFV
jgi:hypothetical protein